MHVHCISCVGFALCLDSLNLGGLAFLVDLFAPWGFCFCSWVRALASIFQGEASALRYQVINPPGPCSNDTKGVIHVLQRGFPMSRTTQNDVFLDPRHLCIPLSHIRNLLLASSVGCPKGISRFVWESLRVPHRSAPVASGAHVGPRHATAMVPMNDDEKERWRKLTGMQKHTQKNRFIYKQWKTLCHLSQLDKIGPYCHIYWSSKSRKTSTWQQSLTLALWGALVEKIKPSNMAKHMTTYYKYDISCCLTLYSILFCHIILYHIISLYYFISYEIISYYSILYCIISNYIISYHIILQFQ